MTLSVANHFASLPIAYRLYLPEIWANDALRRAKGRVPQEVVFKTKPQIAAAKAAGVATGMVLADAGYGHDGAFRAGLTAMGLTYVVGVQSTLSVRRSASGRPARNRCRQSRGADADGNPRQSSAMRIMRRYRSRNWR